MPYIAVCVLYISSVELDWTVDIFVHNYGYMFSVLSMEVFFKGNRIQFNYLLDVTAGNSMSNFAYEGKS